MLTMLAE